MYGILPVKSFQEALKMAGCFLNENSLNFINRMATARDTQHKLQIFSIYVFNHFPREFSKILCVVLCVWDRMLEVYENVACFLEMDTWK